MSDENKRTPGPWSWDEPVWDYNPSEQAPWLIQSATGEPVLIGDIKCKSEFDAHLIAAAPDLYAALEDLLHYAQDGSPTHYSMAIDNAEKALAKARGESK